MVLWRAIENPQDPIYSGGRDKTLTQEERRFLYLNHLSKEFLEQMIPHLKALTAAEVRLHTVT